MTGKFEHTNTTINPLLFLLWVGMAGIVMLFGALTSAYIVRESAGNWLEFQLPNLFLWNTAVILASSMALQLSFTGFKSRKEQMYKAGLVLSFLLGIVFLALQYMAWKDLFNRGIALTGNPSGSFVYVMTGIHALHLVSGLMALGVAIYHAFKLPYEITQKRVDRFKLVIYYWHFLAGLWIYLYLFLNIM